MKPSKHFWTILLMASSVLLLLVLQLLWLRSAYNEEVDAFRKETNSLFRSTIIALQDSLILKNIEPVTGDSVKARVHIDSVNGRFWSSKILADSLMMKTPGEPGKTARYQIRDSNTQVQIFVSSTIADDSIKRVLRPIYSEFRKGSPRGNFVFRLGSDSLKVSDIQFAYQDTLVKSGIPITPSVKRISHDAQAIASPDNFQTDPFFIPRAQAYVAFFGNINSRMLAGISAEILFAVVLTVLIVTAFVLMYRTLVSQAKLVQLKNDLISNITHELKTPVATVSVALEALKNFKALDNPKLTHEYLDIAQNELNRLTLITDKILKAAVFEENGLAIQSDSVKLDQLVQQVLASLKLTFEKANTRVSFTKDGDDFTLQGNAEHLTNVIYNLIDNALKYSKPDLHIELHLKKSTNKIFLTLTDNGIGIPAEYKDKIFEKFFRVPTGDVHNSKGYGLGLSYVASVIKAHGGNISVESEVDKGSTFSIELPC